MAFRENGQSPPIVILSNFIGGIDNDRRDPCKPRMSHLKQKYDQFVSVMQYLFVDIISKFTLLSYLSKTNCS